MTSLEIDSVDTPAVVVDLDVAERNIASMAAAAAAASVSLRPHAKTHKSERIAQLQLDAGARGLSLAKTGEAEVFAARGFTDLFLAYPVIGAAKARRLLDVAERATLSVGVDSVAGAESLAATFAAANRVLDVVIKVDCGYHRVGVQPRDVLALARALGRMRGLRLKGIFTHAGHGYSGETPADVARVGAEEGGVMAKAAAELRADGIEVGTVSVGSTPTARAAMRAGGFDECRPGNYVYHDASQVALGTCGLEDCAMTVIATVISTSGAANQAVVDAGSKTLSSDPLRPRGGGHGLVLGTNSRIARLSEEHGVIEAAPGDSFSVGQRVRILPNHACVVSNLHDRLLGVRGGRVVEDIEIVARGRVR